MVHTRTGARRDALEAGERAFAAAVTIVEHGDLSGVGAAINAAIHAADLAMQEGDAPRGRALLAELADSRGVSVQRVPSSGSFVICSV